MKRIILLMALLNCIGCKSFSQYNNNLIRSGEGYANLQIGKTNMDEIIKKYGTDYKFVNSISDFGSGYAIHHYSYNYKSLGIEFDSDVEEPQSGNLRDYVLKGIIFRKPFKGITTENIILDETKKDRIIEVYGHEYRAASGYKGEEVLVYDKNGIVFTINEETNIVKKIYIFKPRLLQN